jgi:DnaJ-related protein SCJ1
MLFLPLTLLLFLLGTLALATEDYYHLLGISKSATDREIKRAYRNLSKKYHPDKNPNNSSAHTKFVEVAEAYEALSDTNLRKIYDQYGHEGVKQHQQGQRNGGGSHDPFDLFSRFFGGGGHFGAGGGQRRGPDMEVRMQLPLRNFYNGLETEFTVEKQQICEDCEGSGSADGVVETCAKCGGRGALIQKHMLAPGIFQQVQMQCDGCGGQGKSIKHACPVCGGTRVVRRPVTLTAVVEKGMPNGARLTFENEADESPDYVAGNMVVVLQEQEPRLSEGEEASARSDGTFFRRKYNDLWWKEVLSLREAWMGGWTRNLTHLDGHVVRLSKARGEVVQPGQVDTIRGEGMPIYHEGHLHEHHDGDEFGKLYVEYVVVLPDQMEKPMEKDFWALWEKWRARKGVDLAKDSGRPSPAPHNEL